MHECDYCGVRPAVAVNIRTEYGTADLCGRCLDEMKRMRRKRRTPRGKESEQPFCFDQLPTQMETGGPGTTTRNHMNP